MLPISLCLMAVWHGRSCWKDDLAVTGSDGACEEEVHRVAVTLQSALALTLPRSPRLASHQEFFWTSLDNSLLLTAAVEDHKSRYLVINSNKEIILLLEEKKQNQTTQDSLLAVVVLKETFLWRGRRKSRQLLNSICYRIVQNKKNNFMASCDWNKVFKGILKSLVCDIQLLIRKIQ